MLENTNVAAADSVGSEVKEVKEEKKLSDLTQDPKNARKHSSRNIGMIEASLRQVGAARSGVIDEYGVILAGNGTYEALAAAGIDRVKIVEADGNEWVVVKRTGLTEEQKRALSIADNRTSELATWDAPALEAQGIDLAPWFSKQELARINIQKPMNGDKESLDYKYQIIIECIDESEQLIALETLEKQGYRCRALIL